MSKQLFDGQRCNWSLPIIFLMSAPYVLPQSPRECSEHIRPLQALIASENMLHWLVAHVCRAQHVMLLTYSSPNNLASIMELYRNCEHNGVTHNQRTDTHVKVCTSFYRRYIASLPPYYITCIVCDRKTNNVPRSI